MNTTVTMEMRDYLTEDVLTQWNGPVVPRQGEQVDLLSDVHRRHVKSVMWVGPYLVHVYLGRTS